MKGKDLIEWIKENNAEDMNFEVQYRDDGGDYNGTDELYLLIQDDTVIL